MGIADELPDLELEAALGARTLEARQALPVFGLRSPEEGHRLIGSVASSRVRGLGPRARAASRVA